MKVRMSVTILSFCGLATIASAQSVSAQEKAPDWSLSAGTDPTHLDLRTRDPGVDARFIGTLTRSWATRFERLRVTAQVMAGADAPHGFRDIEGRETHLGRSYYAATIGGRYTLPAISRFRPYLTAGTGFYHNSLRQESPTTCVPDVACLPSSDPLIVTRSSRNSLGGNAGIGVSTRIKGREFFVEQSVHVFDLRGGQSVAPFSIGIRF
jgi:hypothetical protein